MADETLVIHPTPVGTSAGSNGILKPIQGKSLPVKITIKCVSAETMHEEGKCGLRQISFTNYAIKMGVRL